MRKGHAFASLALLTLSKNGYGNERDLPSLEFAYAAQDIANRQKTSAEGIRQLLEAFHPIAHN